MKNWKADPETGCWNWTGHINPQGYGVACANGKTYRAHRFVWEQLRGPVDRKTDLHHKCKNTACVNPDHLQPIDPSEHRREHGPEWANLTLEQVHEIRERLTDPETNVSELAEEYGVTRWNVQDIALGRTWPQAGGAVQMLERHCENCGKSIDGRKRGATVCSPRCRQALWVRQNPERWAEIRAKANARRRLSRAA